MPHALSYFSPCCSLSFAIKIHHAVEARESLNEAPWFEGKIMTTRLTWPKICWEDVSYCLYPRYIFGKCLRHDFMKISPVESCSYNPTVFVLPWSLEDICPQSTTLACRLWNVVALYLLVLRPNMRSNISNRSRGFNTIWYIFWASICYISSDRLV